jgi:hypothetical protein
MEAKKIVEHTSVVHSSLFFKHKEFDRFLRQSLDEFRKLKLQDQNPASSLALLWGKFSEQTRIFPENV